jgi:hypothetical protein
MGSGITATLNIVRVDRIPVCVRFSAPVQIGLGPTQPPVQWVPGHSRG